MESYSFIINELGTSLVTSYSEFIQKGPAAAAAAAAAAVHFKNIRLKK